MGEDDGQWPSVGDTDGRFFFSVMRYLKRCYKKEQKAQFKFHFFPCQRNQVQYTLFANDLERPSSKLPKVKKDKRSMKQVQQQATYQEESKELVDFWSSIPSELGLVQFTNLHTMRDIAVIKTIRYLTIFRL